MGAARREVMSTMQRLGSERLVDLNSTVEQQKRVDIHFRYSANYWRDLYNANGLFEVIHQQRRAIVLGLVDELALPSGSHILEIGCGAGLTTIALAQRGFTVQAVDTVDRMVALTRQAATEAGVADRVMTSLGDAHALAFPEGAFRRSANQDAGCARCSSGLRFCRPLRGLGPTAIPLECSMPALPRLGLRR